MNKDDLTLHVLGSMVLGADAYTDAESRVTQGEFVYSDTLPVQINRPFGDDFATLERWGFKFGEPASKKDLLRPVQLPEGWKREGSQQPMWSRVLDDQGRSRLSIFIGPFYEREAFFNIEARYCFDLKELDEATRFYRVSVLDRKLGTSLKNFLGVYGDVTDEARAWFKANYPDADNPEHWDKP